MKRILIILLTITSLASCSKSDDSVKNDQIFGEWKLNRADLHGFQGTKTFDYSNDNIIYNFRSNGILKVTGGENLGYPSGEYNYYFGKDYLGDDTNGSKTLLVNIESSKWIYNFIDGEMVLVQSYNDGPNLIFKRN